MVTVVESEVPAYASWFAEWRDARNKVKSGVNFGIVANDQGFGVTFATIIPESGGTAMSGENPLWLPDIARALDMSTTLHRVLARATQQALST
jgi:hypothetical protein